MKFSRGSNVNVCAPRAIVCFRANVNLMAIHIQTRVPVQFAHTRRVHSRNYAICAVFLWADVQPLNDERKRSKIFNISYAHAFNAK